MGATYISRGKSFRVLVHQGGQRASITVRSKGDAEAMCREIRKQELGGVNVVKAVRQARAPVVPTVMATLEEAVTAFIESQVRAGELRESTAINYRSATRKWLFPVLGSTPVDRVTREQIGGIIRTIREAGRSHVQRHMVNPLRVFYQHAIETKVLPGPNPCADLKWFRGRAKPKVRNVPFFTPAEGGTVMAAMKTLHPRWAVFVQTGFLAGLRWGEIAALYRDDLDTKRGVLTVERTVSGGRVALPKTSKVRHVKVSPALLKAMQDHMEAMALDAQAGQWSPEARRLMFPTSQGNMLGYKYFVDHVWHHTLKAVKVVRRRFHSTRHSYAAWMLSSGADLRFVSDQPGHANPTLTLDVYGRHIVSDRHDHVVAALDKYLLAE